MPFYVATFNGDSTVRFESVDDEDALFTGLRYVPLPKLLFERGPKRAEIILHGAPMEAAEIPVTITQADGAVIFTGFRRHPMTKLPQYKGTITKQLQQKLWGQDGVFVWDP